MSRSLRSDLLLGLAGFALGAGGLTFANLAQAAPGTPTGDTNLAAQADTAASQPSFRKARAAAIS